MATTMKRIALIGLGMMGRPMGHCLHAGGCTLVVGDADPAVEQAFIDAHPGTERVGDGQTLAQCATVITMLPSSQIVDAVVHELAARFAPGSCLIDMSSSDPKRTRTLAAFLGGHGVDMIDAPVSGGVRKAIDGTLAIMVGGDAALVERQRPILELMGKSIVHVGPVGAGHALKALNNYVSAAAMIATAEAIHAGAAFGLAPATIVDVINASTGRNNTTENKAHQFMLNAAFDSGFSLALQSKDVAIAAALGPALGVPMELARKVSAMTGEALAALGSNADHTELYRYLARPETPQD